MRHIFALLALSLCLAIHAGKPWKLSLTDPKEKITLDIDLYEESIEVPDMEMFGPMNGYLGGNIYGVWTVTSFQIKKDKAILRLSNDLGLFSLTEGVETEDQYKKLNEMGCNLFQGYYFAKPMSVTDYEKLLGTQQLDKKRSN